MASAVPEPGRIRITAFVPYQPDTAPSQRFRIEQWVPYLADSGVDLDLQPFAGPELTALLQRHRITAQKV